MYSEKRSGGRRLVELSESTGSVSSLQALRQSADGGRDPSSLPRCIRGKRREAKDAMMYGCDIETSELASIRGRRAGAKLAKEGMRR